MVRRPVAWIVAVVLFVEAFGIAALNWLLGIVVDRQKMSLAGLDPDMMSVSSKIGGLVFGAYFALCGVVALLVALRDRSPAGLGRILLISVAVVHALLGAFAWGLVGVPAFLTMVAVLTLVVLLLMTYDRQNGTAAKAPHDGTDGTGGGSPAADNAGSPLTPPPTPSTP
ncbi:hypothetical protein [Streptomyces sp. NBC_00576]|uniref:hypothetical protein n=1 Tax=Streptomyces sp. NBC_00576 TaxID=2903665 RepID=UPI002E80B3B6|nr:hypothetical protein [Streptomyces sp. NBC_00576]WUB71485.1 hypothetical protein OG734_16035 [Streptomyces sp. NBC_00576]